LARNDGVPRSGAAGCHAATDAEGPVPNDLSVMEAAIGACGAIVRGVVVIGRFASPVIGHINRPIVCTGVV